MIKIAINRSYLFSFKYNVIQNDNLKTQNGSDSTNYVCQEDNDEIDVSFIIWKNRLISIFKIMIFRNYMLIKKLNQLETFFQNC
jgi:hypothetical protein